MNITQLVLYLLMLLDNQEKERWKNQIPITNKFILITVLYNEKNSNRIDEYLQCLDRNLKHPLIETIHVVYDTSKDYEKDGIMGSNTIHNYLKDKQNIKITYINKRPTYGFCFDIANEEYPNKKIILTNADIFFNETLHLLTTYDLTNKFLALTRWNVNKDGSLKPYIRKKMDYFNTRNIHNLLSRAFIDHTSKGNFKAIDSQDTWIFKTPLKRFADENILIGTKHCDGRIAYQAAKASLKVLNPCLSIQCCHLHLSGIRDYDQSAPMLTNHMMVHWCSL